MFTATKVKTFNSGTQGFFDSRPGWGIGKMVLAAPGT